VPVTPANVRASSATSGVARFPAGLSSANSSPAGSETGTVVRPTLDEFVAFCDDYSVVPVWREVLADLETPLSTFVKLVGDREGFLLESVEHAERWGRFSFLGRDPALTLVVRGNRVEFVDGPAPEGIPNRFRQPRRTRGAARALPRAGDRRPSAFPRRHRRMARLRHRARDRAPPRDPTRRSGSSRRGALPRGPGGGVRSLSSAGCT